MMRRHLPRRVALLLALALTAGACSDDGANDTAGASEDATTTAPATTTGTAAPTTTIPPTTTFPGGVPAPNGRRRPIPPDEPTALAAEIEHTERALRDPATVADERPDLGHRNQVAYRQLGIHADWDDEVLAALPADLTDVVRAHLDARRQLAAMHPDPSAMVPAWEIVAPAPADQLLAYYREAEAATGIEWEYLAAINLVETGFGRIRGLSVAGAQGPMQFLPSTWDERGIGEGDIDDPHDAIQAAARYLVRRGGPADMTRALHGYNNSPNYVQAVTRYAELMRADERALAVLHEWEVHYLSSAGDIWLPVGYREPTAIAVDEYLAAAPWSRPV
jgi:soluble lytic murein transglycosylase-like protein